MPRVSFLGDTLLGGAAQDTLDRLGYGHALDGISPLFGNSDLVVANHEGPLTECVEPGVKHDTGKKRYWYRGKPEAACALADAGIRLVSLANNHVLDYGPAGLRDTIAALDAAGIAHCGAGNTRRDARRPCIVEVSGVRIGFVAYMQHYRMYADEGVYATKDRPGPAKLRTRNVAHDLLSLNNVDLRVVLVHWGRNYRAVNPRQRRLAAWHPV